MLGFSHKTLETSLFKVSENSGTVAKHFPYSMWKFLRQIVWIFSETRTNLDEIKINHRYQLRKIYAK